MDTLNLNAEKRAVLGRAVRGLRTKGVLPAELYGNDTKNIHLSLPEADFAKVYKEGGENTIVNLVVDGQTHPTLIYDVQTNPVTGQVIAVDFYQVNLKEKIETSVPLQFVGEAPVVEAKGGILIKAMDEVEIEALPTNIPHAIEVDMTVLDDFGKSIHVADLKVTGDFEIKTDPSAVVATVTEPREEEVEPVAEMTPEDVVVEGEKTDKAEAVAGEGGEKEAKPGGGE